MSRHVLYKLEDKEVGREEEDDVAKPKTALVKAALLVAVANGCALLVIAYNSVSSATMTRSMLNKILVFSLFKIQTLYIFS